MVGPAVDKKRRMTYWEQVPPLDRNIDCQHIANTPEMSIKQAADGKKFLRHPPRAFLEDQKPGFSPWPGLSIESLPRLASRGQMANDASGRRPLPQPDGLSR